MCRAASHVVVTCPACGEAEGFDLARLPCGCRDLPADAIGNKLRCRCGSRQPLRAVRRQKPGPRRDPPLTVVWYC